MDDSKESFYEEYPHLVGHSLEYICPVSIAKDGPDGRWTATVHGNALPGDFATQEEATAAAKAASRLGGADAAD